VERAKVGKAAQKGKGVRVKERMIDIE